MASKFTFDQVQKAVADNGLFMSDADLALAKSNPDAGMSIVNYKLDYKNATTDDQRALANQGAERIRSDYGGYTGGSDGSRFYMNNASPEDYSYQQNQSSFSYEQPSVDADHTPQSSTEEQKDNGLTLGGNQYSDYKFQYQQELDDALANVVNREDWKYDVNNDQAYQAAKKQYLREGERANANTMGQYAAMTGGVPSSAAVRAAQQANDYYNTQLSDKLGQYIDADYQRYIDKVGLNYDTLSALQSLKESGRNEFDTDRNFGYNQWTDELGYRVDEKATDLNNKRYETEHGEALNSEKVSQLMAIYELTQDPNIMKQIKELTGAK